MNYLKEIKKAPVFSILKVMGYQIPKLNYSNKFICPVQNERTPSAEIRENSNGEQKFYCFQAGCSLNTGQGLSTVDLALALEGFPQKEVGQPIDPREKQFLVNLAQRLSNVSVSANPQTIKKVEKYEPLTDEELEEKNDVYTKFLKILEPTHDHELLREMAKKHWDLTAGTLYDAGIRFFNISYHTMSQREVSKRALAEIGESGLTLCGLLKGNKEVILPTPAWALVIPYKVDGKILTLQARVKNDLYRPKYLNSRGRKSIYNISILDKMEDNDRVFVVEGVFDVLALQEKRGEYSIGVAGGLSNIPDATMEKLQERDTTFVIEAGVPSSEIKSVQRRYKEKNLTPTFIYFKDEQHGYDMSDWLKDNPNKEL